MTVGASGIATSVAHPARRFNYWLGGTDNSHAEAPLTRAPEGRTTYLEADLREPAAILAAAGLRETLDPGRPIALMLVAILHFVPGAGAALPLVRELLAALPSGSYLAATHFTTDYLPPEERERYAGLLAAGRSDIWPRERAEFEALFESLELVPPGIALATEWRPAGPASTDGVDASRISMLAAVGRKP
ncbi:SAM-dependent methyltransferase [Actinoplanes subtropicus]|uniref:SAM-dependent methyltransferase n=1 Tax=Actinoplanes subtropicus TaxID=543632 RepID=UPI0004C3324A|nr:SAM-dependent methyltransferase [Actinoplanes subtropicus]